MQPEQDPEKNKATTNVNSNNNDPKEIDNKDSSKVNNTESTLVNPAIANATANNQPKVLSLAIKDLKVLYTAYMPFVVDGGLFIPTKKTFNMGDTLPLMISLMDENLKYSVNGKVVWITPNSSHNRNPGVGFQFTGPNALELSNKIKGLLTNLQLNEITNTM